MDVVVELFSYIFENLEKRFGKEIEAIKEQYPFEPFKIKKPIVKLTFQEGVELLKENGIVVNPLEDLDTPSEKKLGEIVKNKYETDFFILHRYPQSARPFYTMLASEDPRYTNSFDVFMRGQEIISGSQRIHEASLLTERAKFHGINVETITGYIESFKYGAFPHGGFGVGLERVVMFYCALGNIRRSSMFPRDFKRLTP
jgi:aspartyl-tRNA synthetase